MDERANERAGAHPQTPRPLNLDLGALFEEYQVLNDTPDDDGDIFHQKLRGSSESFDLDCCVH